MDNSICITEELVKSISAKLGLKARKVHGWMDHILVVAKDRHSDNCIAVETNVPGFYYRRYQASPDYISKEAAEGRFVPPAGGSYIPAGYSAQEILVDHLEDCLEMLAAGE